jgi:hypothetical protein
MNPARYASLLAIVVYLACLPLDTFCVGGKCGDWPGWAALVFGALLVGATDANTVWLANPLLAVAWLCIWLDQRWVALAFALGALALALAFMSFKMVVTNEGGVPLAVTGYSTGYWVWIASMVLTVVAALLIRPEQARQ